MFLPDAHQRIGQSFDVGVEVIVRNFDSLATREFFDRVGQFVSLRHFRAVDQDWDDRHIALKCTLNFEPYKIILVGAGDPVFSNDSDKRIAGTDLFGKNLEPIDAKVDILLDRTKGFDKRLSAVEKKVWWASGASAVVAFLATHLLDKH